MNDIRKVLKHIDLWFVRLQFSSAKRRDIYSELVALLNAGFSRSEAIDAMWNIHSREGADTSDPRARVLGSVQKTLRNGHGMGEALRPWVPKDEYMIIHAIEHSNRFARHLEIYCGTMERNQGIRSMIHSTLAYPIMLLVMAYGLLVYFSQGIAPKLDRLLGTDQWTGIASVVHDAGLICGTLIPYTIAVAILLPAIIAGSLPRWATQGRVLADRLPVYSMYRLHTGVLLLQSIACLISTGMTAVDAIRTIRLAANRYVGSRLDAVHFHLLNGSSLGLAMQSTANGWPDRDLVLSLRILSRSQDFSSHLLTIAERWVVTSHSRIRRTLEITRAALFMVVFAVISGVVMAMYDLQGQITAAY